ncbi:MAG: lipoyl(octanoyl) transferase LipB [Bacteroidales bacterium]|nr:lipoyl(octanoyl) transferase LipB [Bacteroidales bacterium]
MGILTLFNDLGLVPYQEALDFQEKLFREILHIKKCNAELPQCEQYIQYNYLVFCQHPHVYTLGKSGDESNLLINTLQLQDRQAEFIKTNRGGDITYHGPGQLVGYPILDLESIHLGTRQYIEKMEDALILTLAEYNIESYKKSDVIGVWLQATDSKPERKIAAIGVKVSRFVSMHGFALNISTNMDYFGYINPCGIIDKGVTSMEKELGYVPDFDEIKSKVKQHLADQLGLEIFKIEE